MAHTHTPGPWTVDDTAQPAHMAQCLVDNPTWVAVEDSADDGGHIAYCAPVNAPIIAAAPAMLAALREIAARGRANDPRTQYGGFDADHAGDAVALAEWEAAEIARAAIAAATGER